MNPILTVSSSVNLASDTLKKEKNASVEALTQAAFHLRNTMKKEIKDSIKSPISRTENAQLFKVDKNAMTVDFFLNDNAAKSGVSPARYLSPLIFGGARSNKAMERYFGKKFLIPSPSTTLDAYGNIPRGQVTRMISDLKGFSEVGSTMNAKGGARGKKKQKKKDGFFYIPQSQTNPRLGVVMLRRGSTVSPFAVLTPTKPKYEAGTLDWYYVVEKNWPRYIDEELDKAWRKYFL